MVNSGKNIWTSTYVVWVTALISCNSSIYFAVTPKHSCWDTTTTMPTLLVQDHTCICLDVRNWSWCRWIAPPPSHTIPSTSYFITSPLIFSKLNRKLGTAHSFLICLKFFITLLNTVVLLNTEFLKGPHLIALYKNRQRCS